MVRLVEEAPGEDRDFPTPCSQELANICELCAGHGAFNVSFPDKFKPFLDEISAQYGCTFPGNDIGIACACNWYAWAEFQPSRKQYAQGYFDVSAVVLGTATDQQWFTVLANSTEKGFSDDIIATWAANLGLSMDNVV